MTICLALVCESQESIVAVADRMVSDESLSLEFEQATRKIQPIGKNFAALTSGDALLHTDLLRQAEEDLSSIDQSTVREVALSVEECFMEQRNSLAEKLVMKRAGLDYNTFLDRQSDLTTELSSALIGEYQEVELGVRVLIVGVDSSGAHIYQIEDPGIATCFDSIGYAAIGSGVPHAEGFLTGEDYSPQIPMSRAIWLAYVAKRRSERAPGVGSRFTDILTIDLTNGVRFLGDSSMTQLASMYDNYISLLATAYDSMEPSIIGMQLEFE